MQSISEQKCATVTHFNALDEEVKQTAKFILRINDLIDLLNSSSVSENYMKKAITAEELEQKINLLKEFEEWIESWSFEDQRKSTRVLVKKTLPFKKCLLTTISSFKGLIIFLIRSLGYRYVCTRRFNQDCVENLFSTLRNDRGGFNRHPQADRAVQTLRLSCYSRLIDNSYSGNCEDCRDEILVHIGKATISNSS